MTDLGWDGGEDQLLHGTSNASAALRGLGNVIEPCERAGTTTLSPTRTRSRGIAPNLSPRRPVDFEAKPKES